MLDASVHPLYPFTWLLMVSGSSACPLVLPDNSCTGSVITLYLVLLGVSVTFVCTLDRSEGKHSIRAA